MYVSEPLKLVFLAVPRTGSRSVAQWLEEHHEARRVAVASFPGGHHSRHVLEIHRLKAKGFRVFATVRNPFDALVSWWHHNGPSFGDTFDEYVRAWPTHENNHYTSDGSLFGIWAPHATDVLRFENLEADLARRLGVLVKLPQVGRSDRGPFRDYYSPELRAFVEEMWRLELEAYGYTFDRGHDMSDTPDNRSDVQKAYDRSPFGHEAMSATPERLTPERIWLQPHMSPHVDEWTWCRDRINGPDELDPDVEYVRADIHAELEQAVSRIAVALDDYLRSGSPDAMDVLSDAVEKARARQGENDGMQ